MEFRQRCPAVGRKKIVTGRRRTHPTLYSTCCSTIVSRGSNDVHYSYHMVSYGSLLRYRTWKPCCSTTSCRLCLYRRCDSFKPFAFYICRSSKLPFVRHSLVTDPVRWLRAVPVGFNGQPTQPGPCQLCSVCAPSINVRSTGYMVGIDALRQSERLQPFFRPAANVDAQQLS